VKKTPSIPFAGSQLGESRHVCAFFHSDEEAYRVLLPFIAEGFTCNHKAVHVVNPGQDHAHRRRLVEAGIDLESAEKRGQFELQVNTDAYLRDGRFDPDRMLEVFEGVASGNIGGEFPLSRVVCQMEWAAERVECIDQLIEFESRVNEVWERHEDVVICAYNLGKFSGDTVIEIMRTHPMVIIGGILQENPFYVPPDRFLLEFRERRSHQPAL
jgi:MEDS: MEthanogen/methylotroph, DcmR Sensory domain